MVTINLFALVISRGRRRGREQEDEERVSGKCLYIKLKKTKQKV